MFLRVLILFLSALLFCGCCVNRDYNVVLLGDIHYDFPKYHDKNYPAFKPKVPYGVGTKNKDGMFSWRNHTLWVTESTANTNHNIPLNARMWEKHLPELLDNAAECARVNKAKYAVQLGDMIHGDCGTVKLHQANLRDALNEMDKRFDCPVLTVVGNHDPRGVAGMEAWNGVMPTYLKNIVKDYSGKTGNYYICIGKDLFYFHDVMNPDLDYMEKVFKANPDSRYTFFVSHVPLIPTDKNSLFEILTDDFYRLFTLLESRNAIVLSGHTHYISCTEYKNSKTGHRINQFILNSTVRRPQKQLAFKPGTDLLKNQFRKGYLKHRKLWKKYFNGNIRTPLFTNGSGHALLRVSDKGVFLDYRNLTQKEYHTYQLR
jgi:hypothetical protein